MATAARHRGEAAGAEVIRLTPARRGSLADILYGQLLRQIVMSALGEGERLPSEAEIGRMFGASRPVVRQALRRLQSDGLVYARKGAGTFLRKRPPGRITEFAEPDKVASYLRAIEARMALEPEAARLAAQRRSKDHLHAITLALDGLEHAMACGGDGAEHDLAFHRAIAVATDNELFAKLLEGLEDLMLGSMSMGLGLTRIGPELRQRLVLKEHRQIAEAIRMQDAETAALYMRFHLVQSRVRTTDEQSEP